MAPFAKPVVDLFIRSYYKDLEWLGFCLRSIRKHAFGFRSVIVVIPRASVGAFRRHQLDPDKLIVCDNYRDDYLGQQVTKLYADQLTDAEFITHVDSDVIFTRPTHPYDLIRDGRPQLLMTPYDVHARNAPWRIPWQGVIERFMRRHITYNFMQMMPLTYPRWLYPALRAFAYDLHGCRLASYVMKQNARCFSEFTALGAFAYYFHHDSFRWIDMSTDPLPKKHTKIFWSWGGLSAEVRQQVEDCINSQNGSVQA